MLLSGELEDADFWMLLTPFSVFIPQVYALQRVSCVKFNAGYREIVNPISVCNAYGD